MLQAACKTYPADCGAYPPGSADFDSRTLHRHLGSARRLKQADGTEVARPPIVQFQSWMLLGNPATFRADQPIPIVDDPGRFNKGGVDLWTAGSGEFLPDDPRFDGITTWNTER